MKVRAQDIKRYVKSKNQQLQAEGYQQKLLVYVCRAGRLVILSFYRLSLVNDGANSNMKTRLSPDLDVAGARLWLRDFVPSAHGFTGQLEKPPVFPGGFDSWQETHFEMVCRVQAASMRRGSLSYLRHESEGTGGLYQLAREMTDLFEAGHAGRCWDGDFFDALDIFCESKNL